MSVLQPAIETNELTREQQLQLGEILAPLGIDVPTEKSQFQIENEMLQSVHQRPDLAGVIGTSRKEQEEQNRRRNEQHTQNAVSASMSELMVELDQAQYDAQQATENRIAAEQKISALQSSVTAQETALIGLRQQTAQELQDLNLQMDMALAEAEWAKSDVDEATIDKAAADTQFEEARAANNEIQSEYMNLQDDALMLKLDLDGTTGEAFEDIDGELVMPERTIMIDTDYAEYEQVVHFDQETGEYFTKNHGERSVITDPEMLAEIKDMQNDGHLFGDETDSKVAAYEALLDKMHNLAPTADSSSNKTFDASLHSAIAELDLELAQKQLNDATATVADIKTLIDATEQKLAFAEQQLNMTKEELAETQEKLVKLREVEMEANLNVTNVELKIQDQKIKEATQKYGEDSPEVQALIEGKDALVEKQELQENELTDYREKVAASTEEITEQQENDAPAPAPDENMMAYAEHKADIAGIIATNDNTLSDYELTNVLKEQGIPESYLETIKQDLSDSYGFAFENNDPQKQLENTLHNTPSPTVAPTPGTGMS